MDKTPNIVRPEIPKSLRSFISGPLRRPRNPPGVKSHRHTVVFVIKEWFTPGPDRKMVAETTQQSRPIRHFGTFRPVKNSKPYRGKHRWQELQGN